MLNRIINLLCVWMLNDEPSIKIEECSKNKRLSFATVRTPSEYMLFEQHRGACASFVYRTSKQVPALDILCFCTFFGMVCVVRQLFYIFEQSQGSRE